MALELNGTTGVSLVQDGVVTAADLDFSTGKVLQIVYGSTTADLTTSTSSDTDTDLSASITPSSTSSKVLVLVNQAGCRANDASRRLTLKLKRGTTEILKFETNGGFNTSTLVNIGTCSASFLDSPNSTAQVTYKTTFASSDNNASVAVQDGGNQASPTSTIILMEIAG